jgi:hypothetical protein
MWLVLHEALWLAAVGAAIGLPVALDLSGLVRERLFGVRPQDPGMLIMTAGVMRLVGCGAAYLHAESGPAGPGDHTANGVTRGDCQAGRPSDAAYRVSGKSKRPIDNRPQDSILPHKTTATLRPGLRL